MISKKKFFKAASKIETPTIKIFNNPTSVFIGECFTLIDNTNCKNDVYLGGVQLLNREYAAGNLNKFYERLESTKTKLNRWLEEAKNQGLLGD